LSLAARREVGVSERLSSVEAAVAAIRRGETVIVVDAEERENEGDFVCAADQVTPQVVNFMISHGKGLFCVAVLPDVCDRLHLPPMAGDNTTPLRTSYTVSVDHRSARTGITARERATAVAAMLDPASKPEDFIRPGHLFPLTACEGGVLRRAGHTEAAVDLARLAGRHPSGVLCEILNAEGDRASRDELHDLAKQHKLEIISVEQLIRYRRRSEKLVYRLAEADLPTRFGAARIISYGVRHENQQPLAIVFGNLQEATPGGEYVPSTAKIPLVRLHSSCFTGDLIGSLRCDCGDQLEIALQMMGDEGGVLVYLPQEGRGIGLVEKIKAYHLQDLGMDTVEANLALGHQVDSRDYGIGIQILKDLGLSKIRLLTNNPKKTDAFIYGGFELDVVDQVPIVGPVHEHNARYMAAKRDKMGHDLP
jgi:3,4-dihydroxy 2-butanone 4-phosphate synthase/GTP cyclohydrolase II